MPIVWFNSDEIVSCYDVTVTIKGIVSKRGENRNEVVISARSRVR
jgi:hypothetical protein